MRERWAILLYGLGISGGANVIFEHAAYAVAQGVEITFVVRDEKEVSNVWWHPSSVLFQYSTLDMAKNSMFDVVIATEWRSAYDANFIKAERYVYFVQSIESRFYRNKNGLFPYVADDSYNIPFSYITEASWIQVYLKRHYDIDAKLVRNGIDKSIFSEDGKCLVSRKSDKLRFLIEGSIKNWLKNVPKTVEICRKAGVEDLWLVTSDEIASYQGVDRVFSKVNINQMGDIYRSCDVLVKLSLVEGMFGPPLEMFHCGGTAIIYGIEGADEYAVNNVNSIIVEPGNEDDAVNAVRRLMSDHKLVDQLKYGARKTASGWYGWEKASESFFSSVMSFQKQKPDAVEQIIYKGSRGASIYRWIERFYGSEPSSNRIKAAIELVEKEKKKLILYGAGKLCKSSVILFSDYDVVIDMVVVTNESGNPKSILGHKVVDINTINDAESYVVYVTTEQYYDEIYDSLTSYGFKYIV